MALARAPAFVDVFALACALAFGFASAKFLRYMIPHKIIVSRSSHLEKNPRFTICHHNSLFRLGL